MSFRATDYRTPLERPVLCFPSLPFPLPLRLNASRLSYLLNCRWGREKREHILAFREEESAHRTVPIRAVLYYCEVYFDHDFDVLLFLLLFFAVLFVALVMLRAVPFERTPG